MGTCDQGSAAALGTRHGPCKGAAVPSPAAKPPRTDSGDPCFLLCLAMTTLMRLWQNAASQLMLWQWQMMHGVACKASARRGSLWGSGFRVAQLAFHSLGKFHVRSASAVAIRSSHTGCVPAYNRCRALGAIAGQIAFVRANLDAPQA